MLWLTFLLLLKKLPEEMWSSRLSSTEGFAAVPLMACNLCGTLFLASSLASLLRDDTAPIAY